jgi:putative ABC transport system permease protein
MRKSPPKLARRLLLSFLRDDLAEEVLGDLDEKFYALVKKKSLIRAKLNYWYQVVNYVRPFALRKSNSTYLNSYAMFENYFKIGWRNLSKQKMYSSIKIGGFAIGIAACLLIALFIRQELSYDIHYANGDRIYRVVRVDGENSKGVHFPPPFANALQEDFPELEKAGRYSLTRSFGAGANEIKRSDQIESTHEEGFIFMDQSLLEIFQLPFIYGSPKHALSDPNTMVITKRIADKYFSNEDPIGKMFILNSDENRQYKVTGVIADLPVTSHLQYDFVMTLSGKEFYQGEQTNWRNSNYPVYVLLRPGTDVAQLEEKLSVVIGKYFLPGVVEAGGGEADEMEWLKTFRFRLQPVNEIYLNLDEIGDNLSHGDVRYILLFAAIASFILIIACINFINLSTARSANRAKEVGLRKVVGSQRSSLIKQFLSESLLFSFFSCALGLLLAWILLPYFSTLVAKPIVFPWNAWWLLPVLGAGALAIAEEVKIPLHEAYWLFSSSQFR